jgi:hypothetical protein
MLTKEEIITTFINTHLEENYNLLEDDLVKLANAFVNAAKQKIARQERAECLKFVRSLNTEVAKALDEKRGKL